MSSTVTTSDGSSTGPPEATPPEGGPLEEEPAEAALVFPDMDAVRRFAAMLAGPGVVRGVIGPREAGRLWSRHLLNSAVVHEVCPAGSLVVDLGSGGGLPGVPLALARPDLEVVLLEPMLRRVMWLQDLVGELGLAPRVRVERGRAGDATARGDVIVSRAVAPLSRLLPWSARLAVPGGRVVALKGESAADELSDVCDRLVDWGLREGRVARFGERLLADPTTAVVAERDQRGGDRDFTPVPSPAGRGRGAVRRASRVVDRPRRST